MKSCFVAFLVFLNYKRWIQNLVVRRES